MRLEEWGGLEWGELEWGKLENGITLHKSYGVFNNIINSPH